MYCHRLTARASCNEKIKWNKIKKRVKNYVSANPFFIKIICKKNRLWRDVDGLVSFPSLILFPRVLIWKWI